MASAALPSSIPSQSAAIGSALYTPSQPNAGQVELLPNPHFSFPLRDTESDSTSSASGPSQLPMYPMGRRGSMPHRRLESVNNLPDFSFNPANAARPSTGTSAPQSPWNQLNTPSRPISVHRRRGSEFIGGETRSGGTALSTNPTKGDNPISPPSTSLRPGPPSGRRGHAHRRSGAVSSHDLTSIMTPSVLGRTDSAPATPSDDNEFVLGHSFKKSISQPSLRDFSSSDDYRPPSRTRVGFSDRIEYIRPLSTISSETETSLSTFRGHSATNSLSSIVSSSSPAPPRPTRPTLTIAADDGRPRTAGAVLDTFMSASLHDEPTDRKRPMSAISPISPITQTSRAAPKRRSFFRLESKRSDNSVNTLSTSLSDTALSKSSDSPPVSPTMEDHETEGNDKSKPASRKANRAPRKVKSWANSIMPRKSKHLKKSKPRPSTPPAETLADAEESDTSDDMDFEPNFDQDTTVTIVSPADSATPQPKLDTHYSSWQPRQLTRVDSDMSSPIIDLDAALGPFNTPNGANSRNQQRGFAAHRRAMHSAGGLTPAHRRTESAPELVPFEHRSSVVATTSPMADVFEEDEPEEDEVVTKKGSQSVLIADEAEEPKISVIEADGKQDQSAINWRFNDGLGIQRTKPSSEMSVEPLSSHAVSHPALFTQGPEIVDAVEVVEDFEEPRTLSLTHSSDSTLTPPISADEVKEQQSVMSLSLPLSHKSLMTPDTFTSSFSSPDYRSSQVSFDTPRVGTAASSMSDYPAPSPRFGEPGPELRVSVDDVPSLTSSRSTMTTGYQFMVPRARGDRAISLCSEPSDPESQGRKRTSIASLSRLINSTSHGERSKLFIEQRPQSQHSEPAKEKKRNKRLSKLKFWKSTKELPASRA